MIHSNYTLRFNRTGKEAFGHECHFYPDRHWTDGIAPLLFVAIVGFLIGIAL